jgi:hypothetical protein
MAALYRAREASKPKIPINELIAMAIRKAYLSEPCNTPVQSTTTERKEAA